MTAFLFPHLTDAKINKPHINTYAELVDKLEAWQTPEWVIKALINKENLTQTCHRILDPCYGMGAISRTIAKFIPNIETINIDIHHWNTDTPVYKINFLSKASKKVLKTWNLNPNDKQWVTIMNPPFSLTQQFIEQSFSLGASHVYCFQKTSFFTSLRRQRWHNIMPLKHIYQCGERATCIRFDHLHLPQPQGKENYSWFVYDNKHDPNQYPTISLIYKSDALI